MGIDLTTLTLDEKQSLFDSLAYELREQSLEVGEGPRALWNEINDAVFADKRERVPLRIFLNGTGNKVRLELASDAFDAILMIALPFRANRVLRMRMRGMLLKCLVQYVKQRGLPVTPSIVVNNFGWLRRAIDNSFPGYIEANLLYRIVNATAEAA